MGYNQVATRTDHGGALFFKQPSFVLSQPHVCCGQSAFHDGTNVSAVRVATTAHHGRRFAMFPGGLIPRRKKPCIYAILNKMNGKRYVGSAVSFYSRRAIHRRNLREDRHHSPHLQNAWNLYGEDYFVFIVIEYCPQDRLIEREQHWIDTLRSAHPTNGYNVCPQALNSLGFRHTYETRKKLSQLAKQRELPSAFRKRQIPNVKRGPQSSRTIAKRRGERNGNSKLSREDAAKIKQLLEQDIPVSSIAHLYAVTYQAIYDIKIGDHWTHVNATDYPLLFTESELKLLRRSAKIRQNGRPKLNEDQVREIRALYAAGGIFYRDLANKYDVTISTIAKVVTRQSWPHI